MKFYPLIIFALTLSYLSIPKAPLNDFFQGSVYIKVIDKRIKTLFGKKMFSYKIIAKIAEDHKNNIFYNIHCLYSSPHNLKGDQDYFISNATMQKTNGRYAKLKILKKSAIYPIENTKSLAYFRFIQKQKAQKHLNSHIENQKALKLLSALTLGYLDNKTLNYEFAKLGLSHLLAISGFHFALLSFFLYLFLQLIPSYKIRSVLLLILLFFYVLYLGGSSSVLRAYLGICIYLIGNLFNLKPNALNTLSITFVLSFLFDPNCIYDVGFQLSYSATFAILALYKPLEPLLYPLIPQRNPKEVLFWPFIDKSCFLLLRLIRSNLALSIAVTCGTLPIILLTFEKFPILSLFYNLFMPLLISVTMALLLIGFFFSFCSHLSHFFHHLNEIYTCMIIKFIEEVPVDLQIYIYKNTTSIIFSFSILVILFLFSVRSYNYANALNS